MATLISQIQTQDVDALKCIYFRLVSLYKEILWYGIDCELDPTTQDIEQAFTYLSILNTGCTLRHSLECEIKNFIKKNSLHCIFTSNKCEAKYTVIAESLIITEDNNFVITEDNKYIIHE